MSSLTQTPLAIIQHRRGTTELNNRYVGKPGELTLDTELKQIRLHDGLTPGGFVARSERIGYKAGLGLTLDHDTFNVAQPFDPLLLETKQDLLISGSNIKTLNHNSLIGSGNINIPTFNEKGTYPELRAMSTTKEDVGLSNVDNTADINKPVSNATQIALSLKQDRLVSGTTIKSINNQSLVGAGNLSITVEPDPGQFKTVNGQSILGAGNVQIEFNEEPFTYEAGLGVVIINKTISIDPEYDFGNRFTYNEGYGISISGNNISIDSSVIETLITNYSSGDAYQAGTGIRIDDQTIRINLEVGEGLTLEGNEFGLNESYLVNLIHNNLTPTLTAGTGIRLHNQSINIDLQAGHGIAIENDTVSLDAQSNGYGRRFVSDQEPTGSHFQEGDLWYVYETE